MWPRNTVSNSRLLSTRLTNDVATIAVDAATSTLIPTTNNTVQIDVNPVGTPFRDGTAGGGLDSLETILAANADNTFHFGNHVINGTLAPCFPPRHCCQHRYGTTVR